MKINKQWHAAHRLPRNASFEQRLEWHKAHAEKCGCRQLPENIRLELERRGMLPLHKSDGEG
ncbi:MAG: hypothetical protein M9939_05175 [Mesorhizobium sp.]|nr:hypothetical protein [Mesorhizobium sp.]MCO5160504.1 hypothetical protein [Mesorhizobium sp.]